MPPRESLLRQALDALDEAIMIFDASIRIVHVNAAFCRWIGYRAEELIGHTPTSLSAGWQGKADFQAIWKALQEQGQWQGEIWSRSKNGDIHPDQVSIVTISDGREGRQETHYVCSILGGGQLRQQEQRLQRMAMYDELTDLPNRRLLQVHLEQAMLRSQRHQKLLAVCMLDLDGFKPVNDTHGHEAGDQVLVALGQRIPAAMRKSDLVARVGGDEFVLIIEDINGLHDLEPLLDKINDAITAPIRLSNGALIQLGASMGIALYPYGDETTGDLLLRLADQALYVSKVHKNDRTRYWALSGESAENLLPNSDKPAARLLAQGRVEVFYQPVLSNKQNRIVGIEALARLRDDDGRRLKPEEFLPDLKGSQLTDLSRQVLGQSLADLSQLDALFPDQALWLSVNVDPSSFGRDCIPCLRGVVEGGAIAPHRITLEILESNDFIEREREAALAVLRQIKDIGIRLALDDIGSAYASLMRLKELPIDEIKLDQGFIQTLEDRPQDLHFVRAIQDLALELKVDLIVEGVETEDILDAMLTTGIPYAQGYAISEPLPFEALCEFLKRYAPDTRPAPKSLFGYYAGTMVSHSSIKRMFMINPAELDMNKLGNSRHCRGHLVQQRLGCGDEGHRLVQLHDQYHQAIARAAQFAGDNFRNQYWDDVEAALEEFLGAMLEEWRARKASAVSK